MSLRSKFQSPWFLAAILTGIFFIVTGYKYGWDDQHLEIPLLKHLIDPTLYANDYYIESLAQNFSSFFYPLLAKLITVDQIPSAYFLLYILSRFFLFYWAYKIWLHISQNKFHAFVCVVVFILMARVDEFMYRTFSHQEFALGIIFGGIYFFFKERFLLAAAILGLAANFHALYSLFPMIFLSTYLLLNIKKHGFLTLIKSAGIFALFSLPFAAWVIRTRLMAPAEDPSLYANWLGLFQAACPQNFILPPVKFSLLIKNFKAFFFLIEPYLFLVTIFILNISFNKTFKENRKAIAFCLAAFALLLVSLIFTYIHPVRFVVDLNLIRNRQYLEFLLMGFTALLCLREIEKGRPLMAFLAAVFFTLLKYPGIVAPLAILALICIFSIQSLSNGKRSLARSFLIAILACAIIACLYGIARFFATAQFPNYILRNLAIILTTLTILYLWIQKSSAHPTSIALRRLLIIIPLSVFLIQYTGYHIRKVKEETAGQGFWRLQRNWEDMQRYVKANTAKDAMIFVPFNMEMGGFRILSERKIVFCYRDCGIVGFDYKAALEWQKRLHEMGTFGYILGESPSAAIQRAITHYHADYIVFMSYAAPNEPNPLFDRVYTNKDFALFRVTAGRLLEKLKDQTN